MHNFGAARTTRRIRRDFLAADLEAGFALLRATSESRADRSFEWSQVEEARRVLERARRLYRELPEPDAQAFAARLARLEQAADAADRRRTLTFWQ